MERLGILDSLGCQSMNEILSSWSGFCRCTNQLLQGHGAFAAESEFVSFVKVLCKHGLQSLVQDQFLQSVEAIFRKKGVSKFWQYFDAYAKDAASEADSSEEILAKSLEEICAEKQYLEKCVIMVVRALDSYKETTLRGLQKLEAANALLARYQLMVSSVLLATLHSHFPGVLRRYFRKKLEELNKTMSEGDVGYEASLMEQRASDQISKISPGVAANVDEDYPKTSLSKENKLVRSIGMVVRDLRSLGFTSMTEEGYASAIFCLLKARVQDLAGDDYRTPVLESIKQWIQVVPLRFLYALFAYLGDPIGVDNDSSSCVKSPLASCPSSCFPGVETPSEGLIRWQLRLEYFAYETLQDLRISKLFEIIVDYPDSAPAIEDLKQCLEYTGQQSKLVDSFISALKYRLLTAGASTNDILHQYVSTIKALRTIDPSGVFLEAVGGPIREYLRERKDTIKCIVTMLTEGTGGNQIGPGNTGDSLLEELNRDAENQENADCDDDFISDDRQAWINAERWEPDPVEADPMKGSQNRRKIDILGMMVSIIGSKEQLVNEYRVMLAEKLLNKCDYDIGSEIRTLELLKIHFGEGSMQRCEIMLNDLINSKRTNTNIKATIAKQSRKDADQGVAGVSMDILDATIISSNFWPPIQGESINIPEAVDQLLSDYAKQFHEIKAPRKLLWMKNLGTVKLELEFEDRTVEFSVSPMHAAIIMLFQDQPSWTSKNLAAAVGVPVDTINRRISFWISKGILVESTGAETNDHVFTIVDQIAETNKSTMHVGACEELLMADEDGETCVESVEDQLRKEMTIYEKYIFGMLTNFGGMAVDRIHNSLKIFCVGEPHYDKSLQQLQSFLAGLVAEEKLELRDGMYFLKK